MSNVRQHLMDQLFEWKQRGSLSLWRYVERQRNFPGWHMSGNAEALHSMSELLNAFAAAAPGQSRNLTVAPVSEAVLAIPNNGDAAALSPIKWRLRLAEEPDAWAFPRSQDQAELILGSSWLVKLGEGIGSMARGRGDYSIGPPAARDQQLWFWWQRVA